MAPGTLEVRSECAGPGTHLMSSQGHLDGEEPRYGVRANATPPLPGPSWVVP